MTDQVPEFRGVDVMEMRIRRIENFRLHLRHDQSREVKVG